MEKSLASRFIFRKQHIPLVRIIGTYNLEMKNRMLYATMIVCVIYTMIVRIENTNCKHQLIIIFGTFLCLLNFISCVSHYLLL